jgi:hypothetical protein
MKEIKLTKKELERLLRDYSKSMECLAREMDSRIEHLVESCKDLDKADEKDMLEIYNAFCSYFGADGLRIYEMDELNSLKFDNNIELKRLTENVDLDDAYFSLNLSGCTGCIGYQSFSYLHSFLKYRIPLGLNQINSMLEFTFEEDE